jgi:hypothetical protein
VQSSHSAASQIFSSQLVRGLRGVVHLRKIAFTIPHVRMDYLFLELHRLLGMYNLMVFSNWHIWTNKKSAPDISCKTLTIVDGLGGLNTLDYVGCEPTTQVTMIFRDVDATVVGKLLLIAKQV